MCMKYPKNALSIFLLISNDSISNNNYTSLQSTIEIWKLSIENYGFPKTYHFGGPFDSFVCM